MRMRKKFAKIEKLKICVTKNSERDIILAKIYPNTRFINNYKHCNFWLFVRYREK